MSFDIVTLRSSALTDTLRLALTKLLQRIWQNSTVLSELDGTSFDTDPLNRIAAYFGLLGPADRPYANNDRVRAAIDGIRYSTHWAMESQALIHAVSHA
jgi:hypothetical protein